MDAEILQKTQVYKFLSHLVIWPQTLTHYTPVALVYFLFLKQVIFFSCLPAFALAVFSI